MPSHSKVTIYKTVQYKFLDIFHLEVTRETAPQYAAEMAHRATASETG